MQFNPMFGAVDMHKRDRTVQGITVVDLGANPHHGSRRYMSRKEVLENGCEINPSIFLNEKLFHARCAGVPTNMLGEFSAC